MELKKSHKANLEKRKATNFVVGILISLSLILISFEWTTQDKKLENVNLAPEVFFENEMVEITRRDEPKQHPKPNLPAIIEVIQMVDNDIELEAIDFSNELTKDTWIDFKAYNDTEPEIVIDDVERYFVEIMPTFNGGDPRIEFSRYIASRMKYPKEAIQNGIKGRVYIKFIVNSTGELVNAEIFQGIHSTLDNEALRVVQSSPLWEPGIQSGARVSVTYVFPINFVLHE